MADTKIVGYKNIFGFVLPDWVDEGTIRLFVTVLLASATMLFVLILVIWPKFSIISELKSSLKTGEEKLALLRESKLGLDQLGDKIPEFSQNIILSAIPQSYSPENAVFLLRKISTETPGLSIMSYRLPAGVLFETKGVSLEKGAVENEPVSFISYPIRLTVTAPVESLLTFISKIETSLPFGVVSDMAMQEVSKLAKSSTSKSIQMEIEIKYYQAILKQADISKIKPISNEDLAIVKQISEFNTIGSASLAGSGQVYEAASSSGSLFGF